MLGAGFGARVCGWGARVGVGGGVVSGGGVVTGWWAGAVGRVRSGVSGAGVWGLVLVGLVGVVLLVSVLVLVGWAVFCGCVGGARFLCARGVCLAAVWWVRDCLCGCGVLLVRERGLVCVRVAWVNWGEGACQCWFPLPPLLFSSLVCGAGDGSWTRCLRFGRVALILLGFIRGVLPGCSLVFASCVLFVRVRLFCLRWGVGRVTGLGPAAFALGGWRSNRLSYVRVSRRTVLLVAFACLCARGGAYLSVSFTSVRVVWLFCQHALL